MARIKLSVTSNARRLRIVGSSCIKIMICKRLKAKKAARGISLGLLSELPMSRGVKVAITMVIKATAQLRVSR